MPLPASPRPADRPENSSAIVSPSHRSLIQTVIHNFASFNDVGSERGENCAATPVVIVRVELSTTFIAIFRYREPSDDSFFSMIRSFRAWMNHATYKSVWLFVFCSVLFKSIFIEETEIHWYRCLNKQEKYIMIEHEWNDCDCNVSSCSFSARFSLKVFSPKKQRFSNFDV